MVNPNDLEAPPKTFTFDGAYDMDATTEQIYNEIVFPIVEVSHEWVSEGPFNAPLLPECHRGLQRNGVRVWPNWLR